MAHLRDERPRHEAIPQIGAREQPIDDGDADAARGEPACRADRVRIDADARRDAGLRDGVKIMLGGAPVTADVVAYAGADDWGKDAIAAVELARTWVGGA